MKILVVGAGPAGLAAAVTAAERGARVCLVDENPRPGGPLWRHGPGSQPPARAARWLARLEALPVDRRWAAPVVAGSPGELLVHRDSGTLESLPYDRLILATGARELLLPYPGWTLPHAMGCGGAQTLAKAGMPVRGLKVVVAGSGPLLWAAAAAFAERGARLVGLAEQAPLTQVAGFALGLWRHPAKLAQALAYARACHPVRPRHGAWVLRAEGREAVEAVIMTDGRREWRWECDLLACGYGLVPNSELAVSLGCRVEAGKVAVDERQATSVPGIFSAGEATGIGGEDVALLEGRIAALAALAEPADLRDGALIGSESARGRLAKAIGRRARWRPFVRGLERAYRLRGEVLRLAADDTLVCRCEDVPYGALKSLGDQRTAKLYTRCGMGPCQGRICGAACGALFGWEPNLPRWPLSPVEAGALARLAPKAETNETIITSNHTSGGIHA